jgi:hypothetical protein
MFRTDSNGFTYWDGYPRQRTIHGRMVQEPPQWRIDPNSGLQYWDGYVRTRIVETAGNSEDNDEPRTSGSKKRIKRLPKSKSYGQGITGVLVQEEGEEEEVHTHVGANRGHYELFKYIPGHTDRETKKWIKGHREKVGDDFVGEDLDQEDGKRHSWSWERE